MITLRPSLLSSFADCPRRSAARGFSKVVGDAGFKLRSLLPNIGAVIGTATHAGAAYMLTEKMQNGGIGRGEDALENAIVSMRREVADGVSYDDQANSLNRAEKQIGSMVRAFREHLAPIIMPIAVEERFDIEIEGVQVSGQLDSLEAGRLRDLKTGKFARVHFPQLGAYSLIARSHGHEVDEIVEDMIPRATEKILAPMPETKKYEPVVAEKAALSVIRHLKSDLAAFEETGDETAFLANPTSIMCGEKFCPAWGTRFCREHKQPKEDK